MTFRVCVLLVVDERPTASARSYIAVNIGSSIERYLHRKVRERGTEVHSSWLDLSFPPKAPPSKVRRRTYISIPLFSSNRRYHTLLCFRRYNLGERSPYTDDFSANSLPLAAWLLFPLGYVGVHTTDILNIDIREKSQSSDRIQTDRPAHPYGDFFFFSK